MGDSHDRRGKRMEEGSKRRKKSSERRFPKKIKVKKREIKR